MDMNKTIDTLTVVREMDDAYIVRITHTDETTGEHTERVDAIPRELFETCVRTGYLTKVSSK